MIEWATERDSMWDFEGPVKRSSRLYAQKVEATGAARFLHSFAYLLVHLAQPPTATSLPRSFGFFGPGGCLIPLQRRQHILQSTHINRVGGGEILALISICFCRFYLMFIGSSRLIPHYCFYLLFPIVCPEDFFKLQHQMPVSLRREQLL